MRALHHRVDRLARRFVDERPHPRGVHAAIAGLDRAHVALEQRDEAVAHALVHVDTLDRRAKLAAMRGLRCDEFARGLFQIGIRLDDRGRLAAEFERRLRDFALQ